MSFNTILQTITQPEAMQCAGVDLYFSEKGGDAIVSLATVDGEGLPDKVLATARLAQAAIQTGAATRAAWLQPVLLQEGAQYIIAVAAADATTALQVAQVGEANLAGGWVTAQQAAIGAVQHVNAAGQVTRYPQRSLRFALLAAEYTATQKTVTLGDTPAVGVTSLMLKAGADQPTADARISYTLQLLDAGGAVVQAIEADAGQEVQLAAPHNGTVRTLATVRAGSNGLGAVLEPGTLLVTGTLQTEGTYITPAIATAGGDELRVIFEGTIPPGAAVAVHAQPDGGAWVAVPYSSSSPQTAGTLELTHVLPGIAAASLRLRLTLSGTPTARPMVANLRAVVL